MQFPNPKAFDLLNAEYEKLTITELAQRHRRTVEEEYEGKDPFGFPNAKELGMDEGIMKESELLKDELQRALKATQISMTTLERELRTASQLVQQMEGTFAKQAEYLRGLSTATQGGGIRPTEGTKGDGPADSGGDSGDRGSKDREALHG